MAGEPERAGGSADAALPAAAAPLPCQKLSHWDSLAPSKASTRMMRRFCLTARIPTGWNFRKGQAAVADAPRADAPPMASWRHVNRVGMGSSAIEPRKALAPVYGDTR